MANAALRQLLMLQKIPRYPSKVTVSDIQKYLGDEGFFVNKRSVERDLRQLECHFPLICDDGSRPNGWSYDTKSILSLPVMDGHTAITLNLVEKHLSGHLPQSALEHLRPHFNNAKDVLRQESYRHLASWPQKVASVPRGFALEPANIKSNVLSDVYDALLKEHQLEITYNGKPEQIIHPLGLVMRGPVLYLVCSFFEYEDVRQLAVHRIGKTKMFTARINTPKEFCLEDYIKSGAFGYPETNKSLGLIALFSKDAARHLYETPIEPNQVLAVQEDGRVRIEVQIPDNHEVRWWLQAFGAEVEVLGPLSLRKEFADVAVKLSQSYQ